MARTRDYPAEYRRRKELNLERGLSVPQARGHARKGEPSIAQLKQQNVLTKERPSTIARFYDTVRGVASGKSPTQASKDAGIAPSTVRKLNKDRDVLFKEYGPDKEGRQRAFTGWVVQASARFPILEPGGILHKEVFLDAKNASIVGLYWHAVRWAQEHQDDPAALKHLASFRSVVVYDINGTTYRLETDLSRIYLRLDLWSYEERQNFQRLFGSEKVVVRR